MGSLTGENFFLPSLHEWNQEFLTERNIVPESENISAVKIVRRQANNENEAVNPDEDSDIHLFMDGADSHKLDRVVEFCGDFKTTEALRSISPNVNRENAATLPATGAKRTAFLIEGNRNGRKRIHDSGLTPVELYHALSQPRFKKRSGNEGQGTTETDCLIMDADQRYLYIRDLNAQTVCALAATASEMQTPALRDFIHDHLAFSADIRATIPPTGITSYAIEFHFPFYVLERSSGPRLDHRGLRQIDDISFLPRPFKDGPNPAGSDYLYESQISCCVTGYDDFIWNAYVLVDLYHEDPEKIPNMENLKNYEGFCAGADVPEDPLTADGTPLGNMRQNPRGYFLKTLLSRAREVRERWTILVMKIKSYVNSCIKEPGVRDILAATRSNGVDNADTSQDQHKVESSAKRDDRKRLERDRERRRQLTSWASQTTLLLRKLIECLDSNIDAWRTFSSGGINYFYQPYAPWNVGEPERKSLLAIAHIFKDLLTLRDRLCSLKGLCEDIIPGSVRTDVAYEKMSSNIAQQNTADDIKILTWITFYTLPFQVTATILSTRDGFFPIPAHPVSYLLLNISVILIIRLLLDRLEGWSTYQKLAGKLSTRIFPRKGQGETNNESLA